MPWLVLLINIEGMSMMRPCWRGAEEGREGAEEHQRAMAAESDNGVKGMAEVRRESLDSIPGDVFTLFSPPESGSSSEGRSAAVSRVRRGPMSEGSSSSKQVMVAVVVVVGLGKWRQASSLCHTDDIKHASGFSFVFPCQLALTSTNHPPASNRQPPPPYSQQSLAPTTLQLALASPTTLQPALANPTTLHPVLANPHHPPPAAIRTSAVREKRPPPAVQE
ncbi:hypothetical protein E2C01_062645 [Portunus trituberculatus]|uniref:Uncharacterized protein n=1 Tax=Portunus trituberculatus TaxID=210409 RepID=A0A5B7HE87_PORTR|nr:hypothetical protein [Portunus trituberculatus]